MKNLSTSCLLLSLLAACGTSASDPSTSAQPAPASAEDSNRTETSATVPAAAGEASTAAVPSEPAVESPAAPAGPKIPEDTEIVTTASGLKYSILAPGDGGRSPARGDPVTVHYTGWLENGTVFDSSVPSGAPASFRIGELIEGWNEGLTLMTRGSRFKFTIPSELGYKEQGQAPAIPPNATLIFEVELIDFVEMPKFHAARPELQQVLPTGVKYEVLVQGSPEPPPADQVLVMKYAVWSGEGELLDCSERRGEPVKIKLDALQGSDVPFLAEGAKLLTVGSRMRFDVPGDQTSKTPPEPGQPPRPALVWELELTQTLAPLPVPPFKASAVEALKTTASGLKYEVLQE